MYSGYRFVASFALLYACAGASSLGAQSDGLTPQHLAEAWTGVRTPQCQPKRMNDWLVPVPAEDCVGRGRTPATWADAEVTGTRLVGDRVVLVHWARLVADSSAAIAVRDSVHRALTAKGASAHECKWGARRWLAPNLAVLATVGGPDPAKRGPSVLIQALDDPAAVPRIMCPDAPLQPRTDAPGSAPRRGRIG